jgi:hypothetical protein
MFDWRLVTCIGVGRDRTVRSRPSEGGWPGSIGRPWAARVAVLVAPGRVEPGEPKVYCPA